MENETILESRGIAEEVARTLDKKKARQILVLDIGEKSSFADYFILASGRNERQIAGLADEAEDRLAELGMAPKNVEGKAASGWILMDYGDIIVNLLTAEMRERYNIERVWEDCETILELGNED